jgi:Carboxypeptidase regulatory-like domain
MQHDNWMRFSRTAMAAAVAVVATAPALAQTTTSSVGGTVLSPSGSPVAGATVTVVHVESNSTSVALTDAEGRWVSRGLRVGGPYTITVTKGSDTERKTGVFLALAETSRFDSQLGANTVVVTGTRLLADRFDSRVMGAGTTIGSAQVQSLASISGNLQDLARLDPRISQTDKERGEISALGQNSRYNMITIDGVNISDTFGLEGNNLPMAKQPISIYAIQSVQVNISNYDVSQRGYTGANINAVTKSGTNEVHGALYYSYRNEDMSGERYSRTDDTYFKPSPFKASQFGFVVGGPIVPDRLFFFAGHEQSKSSAATVEFGPIGSERTNVGISQSLIDGLRNVARTRWNTDLGTVEPPATVDLTVKDTLLRLDWTISNEHRAMLRWTRTEQSEPFFPNFGTRSLSLSSDWYAQKKKLATIVAQWFGDWTTDLNTEFRISHRDYRSEPDNNSALPLIAFDVDGSFNTSTAQRTLFAGTERSRHFNKLFTKTLDGYLGINWTLGAHELKFGGEFSQNKIFNAFLQDAYGQYKFQCESGLTYSFGSINCATATAAQIEAAIIENFDRGRATAYQAQLPLPGKTLDDGIARWQLNNRGLFLQDTWTLVPKVTVTLGVRMDTLGMPDKPIANAAAAAPMVAATVTGRGTGTRQTGGFGLDNSEVPDGANLVQPRLGFNWDLGTKESKLQLRGGAGLFQGAAAGVWLSNAYSNTGIATAFYGCGSNAELSGGTNARAACATTGVFNPNVATQAALGANPAANVDFLANGLNQPSIWKMNLALDGQLPWFGLVAGAEWIKSKTNDGIYYKHLNLGAPTATGADGRQLFYNANGYNTNCWTAAGAIAATQAGCGGAVSNRALNNLSYGNVLQATRTGQGGGDAVTLSLSQQPMPGLLWQLAYTRTNAKEVSPLTSSVSNSNWAARSIFNPNEEVAADSAYLVRDRVSGMLSFTQALWGSYKTSVGVTYEGRRGKPYSWTTYNDLNGDGQAGNDLLYIPSGPGSGEVAFAGGAAEEARFWDVVNSYSELSNARGGVVQRNSGRAPWVNNFDVRLTQEIPGFAAGQKGKIRFDIFNFGNLLNKRWGRIDEVAFQGAGGAARSFVNYKGLDANGRYIYSLGATEDYTTRQTRGESQWSAQISFQYEF